VGRPGKAQKVLTEGNFLGFSNVTNFGIGELVWRDKIVLHRTGEGTMARLRFSWIALLVLAAITICAAQKQRGTSLTVVMNDGHQKTFATDDVSRIEFRGSDMVVSQRGHQESIPVASIARMDFSGGGNSMPLGRNHFVGKWEFGTGQGNQTFFVTLDRDGQAHKSLGSGHGTWQVVNCEAHISWDDGWRDVLRKVGDRHEKVAHAPGTGFDGPSDNITSAKTLNDQPI
jgi:hypothetical protein